MLGMDCSVYTMLIAALTFPHTAVLVVLQAEETYAHCVLRADPTIVSGRCW